MWLETKILLSTESDIIPGEEEWEDFMFDTLLIEGFYRYKEGACVHVAGQECVVSATYEEIRDIVNREQAEATYGLN